MQNEGGSQIIGEGQFGFAQDPKKPPVLLPGDPGLNLSQLPFTLGIGGGGISGGASSGMHRALGGEVLVSANPAARRGLFLRPCAVQMLQCEGVFHL